MKKTQFSIAVWAVLLAVCIGCQQAEDSRPTTYPVTGIVTLDGEPVEGAAVSYVPQGQDGEGAAGITDSAGKYELTTFASGDGALPGQYQVKVVKFEQSAAATPEAGAGEAGGAIAGDEAYVAPGEEASEPEPPANQLPEKYAEPSTSGLTATVAEGQNTQNLELVTE